LILLQRLDFHTPEIFLNQKGLHVDWLPECDPDEDAVIRKHARNLFGVNIVCLFSTSDLLTSLTYSLAFSLTSSGGLQGLP
jgi:hypothetical protein